MLGMSEIKRGKYIVFEGGECTGKSTQSALLAERISATWVREPGYTSLGGHIRTLTLSPDINASARALTLLFAADRSQLIDEVIVPTTDRGNHVVSDRSWRSGYAYQTAQGEDGSFVTAVNKLAIGSYMEPDLLILLDGDPEELAARRARDADRFEAKGFDFHHRVRENLLEVCGTAGAMLIDATASMEEVSEIVWGTVEPYLR